MISMCFINLCVLVTFTFVGSLTYTGEKSRHVSRHLLRSLLSVTAGAALIFYSVTLSPGIRVDYRYMPVALAGLFGGPLAALGVALPLIAYRLWIGGIGASAGVLSLLICALLASLFAPAFRARRITRHNLWIPPVLFALTDLSVLIIPGQGLHLFRTVYPGLVLLHSLGLIVVFGVLQSRFGVVAETQGFERLAYRDGLTGALNRRAFDRDLGKLQEGATFLLLLDLDRFKVINDERGHPFGDRVLIALSSVLHEAVRGNDQAYRIGGEEFAVVLQGTDSTGAASVAERIRHTVEHQLGARCGAADLRATVSIGLTAWTGNGGQSLQVADRLLYQAKDKGRNQVQTAVHPTGPSNFAALTLFRPAGVASPSPRRSPN